MLEPISATIAVSALGVSAVAAAYTRKQARAAQVQADDLRDIRHERQRPRLEVSAERIDTGILLVVTNAGLESVDAVEVELSAVRNDATGTARTRALAETQSWKGGPLGQFRGQRTSVSLTGFAAGQIAVVVLRAMKGDVHWEWLEEVPVPSG